MSDAPSCEVAPCRIDKRWTGVLWFGWLFIIMFYFIGASVSVDWGNRSIPFLTALETIRWHKFIEILHEGREVLVIYASTIICVTYTVCSSIKFRLVTMNLGFGFPFFIIGFDFQVGGLIAIAPMMILFMVGELQMVSFISKECLSMGLLVSGCGFVCSSWGIWDTCS